MKPRVLVVDDHVELAETLAEGLSGRSYEAFACGAGAQASELIAAEPFDVLVTDLRMPGVDGMELMARFLATDATRPVIMMTAYGAVDTAVEAIRRGAYHYLTKPFAIEELVLFVGRALDDANVRREARTLRAAVRGEPWLGSLVASSAAMREVADKVALVADSPSTVLLVGETGTGKTAIARVIHSASARSRGAFVAVNCAALPDALLESELFGHVKGAFTGASAARIGLFAEANGGTLLLDEIAEMSVGLQAKLLTVLETGAVRPVGASKERPVDVRVIAATHRDLRERVRAGAFREDLLYRLDVVSIEIPPLRHRRDDLPLLAEKLLARARDRHPRSPVESLSSEAMARVMSYAWPGNVRELANAVERVVALGRAAEGSSAELPVAATSSAPEGLPQAMAGEVLPIREVQRRYALWALERLGGHRRRTAETLGVDIKTLAKWLGGDGEGGG